MKIRTASQLNEFLNNAIAWRKREISAIHLLIERERDSGTLGTLRRTAAPILYAHWEGFVKEAGDAYVEFVARQHLRYDQLQTCFVAIACGRELREARVAQWARSSIQLVDFLLLNQDDRARIPYKRVIETESNLSSRVLRDIFLLIGLDYADSLKSKELLIDGSLLRLRNAVSHGERTAIDASTYRQLEELVLWLLDFMKDAVENSAILGRFRR